MSVRGLTPREKQVLALIAAGHSAKSAAREIALAVDTINNVTTHIRDKLQAKTTTQAVAIAVHEGAIKCNEAGHWVAA